MRAHYLSLAFICFLACDNEAPPQPAPEPPRRLSDLKPADSSKATEQELQEARRKAGFRTNEEVLAEATEKYERQGRIYIKQRLDQYRKLSSDIAKQLDMFQDNATKLGKKADASGLTRFLARHDKVMGAIAKRLSELSANGTEGANTQASLGELMRSWADLRGELTVELAGQDDFASTIDALRNRLSSVNKTLDEIASDDSLSEAEAAENRKAETP